MRKAKIAGIILIVLSIVLIGACSKPPKAELSAAVAAVAKAEADPDTVEYAAESLKRAKDSLSRMEAEVAAKKYDSAKTLAGETVAAAERAMADGKTAKARARDEASALVGSIKASLAEVQNALASARKVRGINLDAASVARDIQAAGGAVTATETDFAGGNYRSAIQKGQAARASLNMINNRIAEAVQAVSRKK